MTLTSPHPGIINFFFIEVLKSVDRAVVSVPSSGDYQFLLRRWSHTDGSTWVSVPSSGDYQFLPFMRLPPHLIRFCFRPLIRGLSISSVINKAFRTNIKPFPSPHPGIINFFRSRVPERSITWSFRPLIRGLSISSLLPRAI